MNTHRDIPDEVVARAQDFDHEHWRADRDGERGGQWGSVPADQVRRLLWGAYGGAVPVVVAEDESRPASMLEPVTFSGDDESDARRVPMRAVDEAEDAW